ncbi:MAG: helix-turn-helix domain-containing protein [Planctomycetes bacterium]|nr:helix-turn-helix domain-containing protein [Planctomycetota bacterium]
MGKRGKQGGSTPDAGNGGRARAWSIVTFAQLEEWRQRQGLPKKRVADLLGVTNSTYHNWARGLAVATPSTQHKIHELINGGRVLLPRANGGPAAHNGSDEEAVLTSTAQIVNAYLQASTARLTPEQLCQLIRDVSRALMS